MSSRGFHRSWYSAASVALTVVCVLGPVGAQSAESGSGSAGGDRKDAVDEWAAPELFPKDERFILDLKFGSGFSFSMSPERSGVFQSAPGQEPTWNLLVGTFSGAYAASESTQLGFSLPLGLVMVQHETLPGISDETAFGVGDLQLTVSRRFFRETAHRPAVHGALVADSGTAEHDSLGDGFASAGVALRLQKSVSPRVYLLGGGRVVQRFEEEGFDPGLLWAPSLGAGVLSRGGRYRLEAELVFLQAEESEAPPGLRFARPTGDSSETVLSLRARGAETRHSVTLDVVGTSELSESTIGFSYTFPLYPRRRFLP